MEERIIPSPKTTLNGELSGNASGTRYKQRLDGVARERVSSRYCGKLAMEGQFEAKQQLYRVLNKILS